MINRIGEEPTKCWGVRIRVQNESWCPMGPYNLTFLHIIGRTKMNERLFDMPHTIRDVSKIPHTHINFIRLTH